MEIISDALNALLAHLMEREARLAVKRARQRGRCGVFPKGWYSDRLRCSLAALHEGKHVDRAGAEFTESLDLETKS